MLNKILIVIGIVFLVGSSILVAGVVMINNRGIEQFTQSELQNQENGISLQNDNAFRNLSILNKAHAYWTEAHDRLLNRDVDWINTNLTEYLYEGDFDIDFVYLTNEDGSFVQANGIQKSVIESTNLFQQLLLTNESQKSILWVDGEAYFLSGFAITNDDEGDPIGALILGRKLDSEYKNVILAMTSGVHENHLFIVQDINDVPILDNDINYIYYESLDDTVIYAIHYEFAFVTYIQENMIGHSITLVISAYVILLIATFLLLNVFRKEMGKVVITLKNLDIEQETFQAFPDTKSPEINEIIHSFNHLGKRVEQNMLQLKNKNLEVVELLSMATEFNDPYTNEHSNNVSEISGLIGEKMNIPDISKLKLCAKLHDVGKVFLQHDILNKNGKVTLTEYNEIKKHPTQGAELLSAITGFDDVRLGVKHHHERFDGSGYPDGLKGLNISLYARIVCVADVYDAITSNRPYRKAFTKEAAIKIMKDGRGKSFDPTILDAFLEIFSNNEKI